MWIHFENPNRKKSWVDPDGPSTSTARPKRFGRMTMLCVWWDQSDVIYYELLKSGKRLTLNVSNNNWAIWNVPCFKKARISKEATQSHFLHDNAPSRTTKPIRGTLEALSWEILPHTIRDLVSSDYNLFASMVHAFAEQRFGLYGDVKKWLDERFIAKVEDFYAHRIHRFPERWKKSITSDGAYFV